MNINPTISEFVKHQFPDFYQEEGENFIAFVETYYKWLEQEGGVVKQIRDIPEITDIDKTPEAFLENFKETYMSEFPSEILGNLRLLQKHILELYRSKGSDAGLALLFRLLFNTEVKKYIPSYDIFKASDGIWVEPMYIEVTDSPLLHNFSQRVLYGQDSKSSAICERIEYKNVNDKNICQIYVSNVRGNFNLGEKLYYEGMDINNAPYVIGSIRSATPVFSSIGFDVGEIISTSTEDTAKPVKAVVIGTQPANGIVDFLLVDGGHAYSKGANISVTYGTATTGTGAIFVIDSLKDTFLFKYHSESISPYLSTAINATTYGFPKFTSANLTSIIDTSLIFDMVELGTIDRIRTTNPGVNYNGTVNVSVIEPISVGTYLGGGDDAIVIGSASLGDGYVNQVKIIDSGFGNYGFNEWYTFNSEEFPYKTVTCKVAGSAVGISEGYFDDTKGFLSEDKFLADGHYYQDFSYVIKSRYTIDDYISVLRKLYHPSGNAVFADILLDSETDVEVVEDEISHSLSTPWLPRGVGNYPPSLYMGAVNDKYWYSGNVISSFAAFNSSANGIFTRSTSKTCFDSNGLLTTVPVNTIAVDYDPITKIRRGLRLEGSGTNRCPNSLATGAVYGSPGTMPTGWAILLAGGLSREIIAPQIKNGVSCIGIRIFGTPSATTICTIQPDNAEAQVAGSTWTNSIFLGADNYPVAWGNVLLRANNEVAGTPIVPTSNVERYSNTRTITGASARLTLRFSANDTVTPVDFTFWLALPQREEGSLITSPIPTSGTALTRATDSYYLNTAGWLNPDEGTIFVDYTMDGNNDILSFALMRASGGLTGGSIYQQTNSNVTTQSYKDGAVQGGHNLGTSIVGQRNRLAVSFKTGEFKAVRDGTAVTTRTDFVMPTDLAQLWIGNRNGLANPLYGWFHSFTYFPKALTDAELQALTT